MPSIDWLKGRLQPNLVPWWPPECEQQWCFVCMKVPTYICDSGHEYFKSDESIWELRKVLRSVLEHCRVTSAFSFLIHLTLL